MKSIRELFPLASAATVAANPQMLDMSGGSGKQNSIARRTVLKNAQWNDIVNVGKQIKRGMMNKTEAEYALILEAQKRSGEILRYEFEGITLRWADMRYTPDFVVFIPDYGHKYENPHPFIKLIEVKGGHIWDRDIVRFKGARAYWPEFVFEMWQLKKGQGWKRKY